MPRAKSGSLYTLGWTLLAVGAIGVVLAFADASIGYSAYAFDGGGSDRQMMLCVASGALMVTGALFVAAGHVAREVRSMLVAEATVPPISGT